MTRKYDNLYHRKHRKDIKTQKSQGSFKKITKNDLNKPPNLSQYKARMIQSLKSKYANSEKTIYNLYKYKQHELSYFLKYSLFYQPIDPEPLALSSLPSHYPTKHYRYLNKLIEASDIILYILDARDPLSCRCKPIYRKILSLPDKKIIILLNKIDLVPMENAFAWQTYLRREFPVVMFKANLQNQNEHLSTFSLFKKSIGNSTEMADTLIHSTKAIGTDHLIQLIKQLSKVEGSNRAVTVGLIGYPNVGKSSVINSLKRSKTCEVSSIPGCTKNLKEVKLDSQVKLLDCPGVIFERELTKNQLVLQNTAKYGDNLEEVVDAILERIEMKVLCYEYGIEPFVSVTDFLAKVCRGHGKLGKGGVPYMKQGAKMVVEDWNRGKLKYFTIPPVLAERENMLRMLAEY